MTDKRKTDDELGDKIMELCQGKNAIDAMSTLMSCIGSFIYTKAEQLSEEDRKRFIPDMEKAFKSIVSVVEESLTEHDKKTYILDEMIAEIRGLKKSAKPSIDKVSRSFKAFLSEMKKD